MNSYAVIKDDYRATIVYMDLDTVGYSFKPKKKRNADYISVSNVVIYNKEMIDFLINKMFVKKFETLSNVVLRMLYSEDDDTDESDFFILLDEVARLKAMLEIKFKKFLKIEEYKDYLDKLTFVDGQLRQRIAIINYQNSFNYENEYHRSL